MPAGYSISHSGYPHGWPLLLTVFQLLCALAQCNIPLRFCITLSGKEICHNFWNFTRFFVVKHHGVKADSHLLGNESHGFKLRIALQFSISIIVRVHMFSFSASPRCVIFCWIRFSRSLRAKRSRKFIRNHLSYILW